MIRTYRTNAGTELPLLNLKGRDYLEVKYRLVWFREEHPTWSIKTTIRHTDENSALFCAEIIDDEGTVIGMAHKYEDRKGFPDFIEKAETGAIGRALALCGYGTQFCAEELDEGERIVDSPVQATVVGTSQGRQVFTEPSRPSEPGKFRITFGKYRGKLIEEIGRPELQDYVGFLVDSAAEKGEGLSHNAALLKMNAEEFFAQQSPKVGA